MANKKVTMFSRPKAIINLKIRPMMRCCYIFFEWVCLCQRKYTLGNDYFEYKNEQKRSVRVNHFTHPRNGLSYPGSFRPPMYLQMTLSSESESELVSVSVSESELELESDPYMLRSGFEFPFPGFEWLMCNSLWSSCLLVVSILVFS